MAGIGVMGGTFDPIHIGHLAAAEEARDALGLSRVLFVPAARPPHKAAGTYSAVEHRVAMVRLALAGNDAFELSTVELDRPGPSYTLDTLLELQRSLGVRDRDQLTLILSAETFRDLPTWHEPERILAAARVAVVPRDGYAPPDPAALAARLAASVSVTSLEGPRLAISSSDIRRRVAAGRSIRYLVPAPVVDYIRTNDLYLEGHAGSDQQ